MDDLVKRVKDIIVYLDARPHGAARRPKIDATFGPNAATYLTQLIACIETLERDMRECDQTVDVLCAKIRELTAPTPKPQG